MSERPDVTERVATFAPPVRDDKFCTVVLPVRPGTSQHGQPDRQSLYVCAKSVPCPDHPQDRPGVEHVLTRRGGSREWTWECTCGEFVAEDQVLQADAEVAHRRHVDAVLRPAETT